MSKYCFIIISSLLILAGCSTPGIQPLTKKQLSNNGYTPEIKTNILKKELEVKIPSTTNIYKIDIAKLKEGETQKIEIKLISPEQKIKLDFQERSFNISNNFLLIWYGTLIFLGVLIYWVFKIRKRASCKHKQELKDIPSI